MSLPRLGRAVIIDLCATFSTGHTEVLYESALVMLWLFIYMNLSLQDTLKYSMSLPYLGYAVIMNLSLLDTLKYSMSLSWSCCYYLSIWTFPYRTHWSTLWAYLASVMLWLLIYMNLSLQDTLKYSMSLPRLCCDYWSIWTFPYRTHWSTLWVLPRLGHAVTIDLYEPFPTGHSEVLYESASSWSCCDH